MSSIESSISDLTSAAQSLTTTVNDKVDTINDRLAAAEQQFQDYITTARAEYGHVCYTHNQIMELTADGTAIRDFNPVHVDLNVSVAAAFQRGAGSANGWPSAVGEEFGNAINVSYFNIPFNIIRVVWTNANQPPLHPARFNNNWFMNGFGSPFTEAAYIKVISGNIGGDFELRKSYADGWGLYGHHNRASLFNGHHSGLVMNSPSGEMLITLHGKATGHVDLDDGQWTLVPSFPQLEEAPAPGTAP